MLFLLGVCLVKDDLHRFFSLPGIAQPPGLSTEQRHLESPDDVHCGVPTAECSKTSNGQHLVERSEGNGNTTVTGWFQPKKYVFILVFLKQMEF